MKAIATAMACLGAAVLTACAPYQTTEKVVAVSYQQANDALGRNVGLLRRMAVMEVSQFPPKACGYDGHMEWLDVDPSMRRVLVNEKGYELVEVDASQRAEALLDEIAAWPSPSELVKAGPGLAVLLENLRTQQRVDALLVRLDRTTCPMADSALRAAMGVLTLGLNELLPTSEMMRAYFITEAWMFETATAKLVWRHTVRENEAQLLATLSLNRPEVMPTMTELLLEPLEPAIPRLLTR